MSVTVTLTTTHYNAFFFLLSSESSNSGARLQKKYTDVMATVENENIVDQLITGDVLTLDDKDVIESSIA